MLAVGSVDMSAKGSSPVGHANTSGRSLDE